jgi:hypothetical protein
MRVRRAKTITHDAPTTESTSASAEPNGHWNVSMRASTTVTAMVFTRRPPMRAGVT